MKKYRLEYGFTKRDLEHNILTKEEERSLSKKIFDKREQIRYLKDKVSGIREGHSSYLFEIRREDLRLKKLRDYFVESNLKLAIKYARLIYDLYKDRFNQIGVQHSDLLSDFSSVVLPNAVDKYNSEKGAFSTFAVRSFYNWAQNALKGRYGYKQLSIDSSFNEKDDFNLKKILDSGSEKPSEELENIEIFGLVRSDIVRILSPIQLRCIELRYGFNGEELGYTNISSRIADEGFVSPDTSKPYTKESIRQILLKAIKRLNEKACRGLKDVFQND